MIFWLMCLYKFYKRKIRNMIYLRKAKSIAETDICCIFGGVDLEQFEMISAQNIVVEADQTPGQVSFRNFPELKQYMEKGLSV